MDTNSTNNTADRRERAVRITLAIVKFAVLLFIIIGIPLLIYLKYPGILDNFKSLDSINALLDKYHTKSMFIYIGMQVVQIVIAFLPGQALQLAAGYAYGFWAALLLSLVGITIGTIATFYIGRIFGKDMVYLVFGKERLERFITLLNSRKAYIAVFLLYLFPGIPKDVFSYAAGISEMKMLPFTIISIVARTPALAMSLVFGNMLYKRSYIGMAIVAAVVITIAVVCAVKRKRVYAIIDKLHNRFSKRKKGGDN
ncbi:MAG: TVP38/TMEM64 family protein [Clostridiales Family XIII bacterium]|jgi:uncharacterized membrane protein YdjX (TVP38/TMEM64 family)|nr:TVP38/TMEM64 family protein [Clostridiales Family XIII bacterium]